MTRTDTWEKVPLYYVPQCLLWTEISASLLLGQKPYSFVERDCAYRSTIEETLWDFWWRNVKPARERDTVKQ